MKQLLYTLIGVVVILGILFIVFGSNDIDEQMPQATPVAVISPESGGGLVALAPIPSVAGVTVAVSMSDEAFEPATLNISAGDTVVFTNNGQALHWIASDPHPAHNDLPGFDAKKGLATGETYSYTFVEAGTYGMHDHLNTKIKGTIVAE
ncbi:MAG: cupredoxin domain-containing protein [bacterium]|nr:cupredoxin domain-containing protein [bacterium]